MAHSGPMGFAFQRIVHDRDAVRRQGDWRDPGARVLCVGGEHVATDPQGGLRWFAVDEVPVDAEFAYLGVLDGFTYLAALVERVPAEADPQSVRQIGSRLSEAEGSLLIHAVGLSQWHRRHRRCAQCGAQTEIAQAGHTRECPACGAHHFPRTDPAVIMLITDGEDRALLGHQPSWPERRYSTLAGFVEPGESLEDAVRREVAEEVGISVGAVRYGASQPWPFPSSLMVGFFGTAETTDIRVDGAEIADARWFSRAEVTALSASGELIVPGRLSISRWLLDTWHGGEITGSW